MIKNDKMRRGAAKNGQDKNLFGEETSKYQRMSEPDEWGRKEQGALEKLKGAGLGEPVETGNYYGITSSFR